MAKNPAKRMPETKESQILLDHESLEVSPGAEGSPSPIPAGLIKPGPTAPRISSGTST